LAYFRRDLLVHSGVNKPTVPSLMSGRVREGLSYWLIYAIVY